MPTHTYCYARQVPADAVEFDVRETPSYVGAITDRFWRQPGSVRSNHPTHSLAAIGPEAETLCSDHWRADTPCGKGTPYERLVALDCSVLMFGVTMDTYTLFHTAEDATEVSYLYEPEPYLLRAREVDGTVREVVLRRHDMSVHRRFGELDTWLEERALLGRQKLGQGELLFIPHARDLHDRVVAELRRDPLLLVAQSARKQVAQRFGL